MGRARINAGGPDAAAAFFRQSSWHLDLARRSDGSFTYDAAEQYGAGKIDDNTYSGKSGYYGLSPIACSVLTDLLPLMKLLITGRDARGANRVGKADVAEVVASGRFDLDRKAKSAAELVEAFDDGDAQGGHRDPRAADAGGEGVPRQGAQAEDRRCGRGDQAARSGDPAAQAASHLAGEVNVPPRGG